MPAPHAGRCVCGAVAYRLNEEPLTLYACHCTDCQKRSGSAFGLSMWVRRAALEVTRGEAAQRPSTTPDGRASNTRICAHCVARLWTEPPRQPELAVLRPGTLDDTAWLVPVAHLWTRSAQPWFAFPEGAARFDTQPEEMLDLVALWQARR